MKDAFNILLDLTNSFVLAGGLGFITTYILSELGTIHFSDENKDEKKLSLILFSIIDIVVYLLLDEITSMNIYLNLLFTLIVVLLLSFTLFNWCFKLFLNILNFFRENENLGEIDIRPVRDIMLDTNKTTAAYLFDMNSDKLITFGVLGWISHYSSRGDFEMQIIPVENELLQKLDFDEAMALALNNDGTVYLNFDKKIKMVIIYT